MLSEMSKGTVIPFPFRYQSVTNCPVLVGVILDALCSITLASSSKVQAAYSLLSAFIFKLVNFIFNIAHGVYLLFSGLIVMQHCTTTKCLRF